LAFSQISVHKCVSPDDIRKEITGNISDQSKNNEVWIKAYERLRTYLECGFNVIFDSTACNVFTVKTLQSIGDSFNCEIVFKLFETDEQTAFDRSNVPRMIIRQQLHNYETVKRYLIDSKFIILDN
jgi:predicted kinase